MFLRNWGNLMQNNRTGNHNGSGKGKHFKVCPPLWVLTFTTSLDLCLCLLRHSSTMNEQVVLTHHLPIYFYSIWHSKHLHPSHYGLTSGAWGKGQSTRQDTRCTGCGDSVWYVVPSGPRHTCSTYRNWDWITANTLAVGCFTAQHQSWPVESVAL